MSNPRVSGEARKKRLDRSPLRYPKLVWKYDRGKSAEHVIDVFFWLRLGRMSTIPKIHDGRRDRG